MITKGGGIQLINKDTTWHWAGQKWNLTNPWAADALRTGKWVQHCRAVSPRFAFRFSAAAVIVISVLGLSSCAMVTQDERESRAYLREDNLIRERDKYRIKESLCWRQGGAMVFSKSYAGRLTRVTADQYRTARCVVL